MSARPRLAAPPVPAVAGILTASEVRRTAEHIAGQQLPSGQLPWFRGHHADPWDHVEAAMALGAAGLVEESRAAYDWLAATQAPDGSWPMETVGDEVTEPTVDTNQVGYLAVGLWHDHLLTGDADHLAKHWRVLERALDLVVSAQRPDGTISWARSPKGEWADEALLTGSSCLVLSLTCAGHVAARLGHDRPTWRAARTRLAAAVREGRGFTPKDRFSMDWYYPILGGAVRGAAARDLLQRRWADFVVPGYGIRCVDDHPWATAAESAELVLALDAIGDRDRAVAVLADVQHHRDPADGGYWTGYVWPDAAIWPQEKTTWSAGAVILAADALSETTAAARLFADAAVPTDEEPS